MKTYKLVFTVNGKRTETLITASSLDDAKRIVRAQYSGARISFISASS